MPHSPKANRYNGCCQYLSESQTKGILREFPKAVYGHMFRCTENTLLAVESLPRNGVYTLVLFLSREISLKVGALGPRRFLRGYYTYTGSALGLGASSLRHRVLRHLKTKRRRFWHIDYLLDHKTVYLTGLVAGATDTRVECTINRYIKTKENGQLLVSHFGASDCKKNCGSHLLYYPDIKEGKVLVEKIRVCYKTVLGGKRRVYAALLSQ